MLTPLLKSEGVINVENWAEIRRLHRSEGMGIKTIARRLGVARNTVRAALAAHEPPKYTRAPAGSSVDVFEDRIRVLLVEFPDMPATVIAERVGWTGASSVLRARVALLRPAVRGTDPADRTTYVAGEVVQCDLWFPERVVPDGAGHLIAPPVLTLIAGYSRLLMAMMLPTRTSGDLLAGMWSLLAGSLQAVPKMLVWDNEAGIGQHKRLTVGARSFAGTLGLRIYQTAVRDPEAKGMVERANGFLQTSFMPGRSFTGGPDFNNQLSAWLPKANSRLVRATGARPLEQLAAERAAMGALPPLAPAVGTSTRVRLARDYYVRVAGNDYSVDPTVIGRFVDVTAGLERVQVSCAGTPVADHARCWSSRQTITDPGHVQTAAGLREAFQERARQRSEQQRAQQQRTSPAGRLGPGQAVGLRSLSDYDAMFDLRPPGSSGLDVPDLLSPARPDLQVVR